MGSDPGGPLGLRRPFSTLGGARPLAEDLVAEAAARSVLIQHRGRGSWLPAWGFGRGRRA
jgi:hypothetical protein